MGKRKITCNNSSCKHHTNGGCDTCITLDGSGKCKSFEKRFCILLSHLQQEQDAAGQQDKEEKEFGWLSPTGVFTESPFGTHEESAEQICEEKGFTEEYWNWVKENRDNEINHLMRDFLSEVKGYCLIHNPSGYTGYIVTNMKNLTKQQKEFLYGYFMDMGDRFKAEQFVDFD